MTKIEGQETFLLYPADGDIDEDEGMTKFQILEMLAEELGYILTEKHDDQD